MFAENSARDKLLAQFGTTSLKGFGIEQMPAAITAAGAILYYLEFTEHRQTGHISSISRIDEDRYVWIDKFSIRNLELFTANGGQEGCSLFDVLDRTGSPDGRADAPALDLTPAERPRTDQSAGLDVVSLAPATTPRWREMLAEAVASTGDLERIISRVAVGRVTPREVVQLKNALYAVEKIKTAMEQSGQEPLREMAAKLDLCLKVRDRIDKEIYPDPSNQIQKGGVIAQGVSIELDDLRNIASHGKEILASIQQRESEATGIPSLKISFNNVFGYYIEVHNTHKDKVPSDWSASRR